MRINTNFPALQAYTATSATDKRVNLASKRLASGVKIQAASDDPAGRAISNKLDAQVRGLQRASQNSANAISLVQTAEGALNEIHSVLQRINELCVQAANGTNTTDDLKKIQLEIDQMKDEVNSTAFKTDFNKVKLLNGDADRIVFSANSTLLRMSNNMTNATYRFDLNEKATKTKCEAAAGSGQTLGMVGDIFINGVMVRFNGAEDKDTIFENLREAAEASGFVVNVPNGAGDSRVFSSIEAKNYGSSQNLSIVGSNPLLLEALGFTPTIDSTNVTYAGGLDDLIGEAGDFYINGTKVTIKPDDTIRNVKSKLTVAANVNEIKIDTTSTDKVFDTLKFDGHIQICSENPNLLAALGFNPGDYANNVSGKDVNISLVKQQPINPDLKIPLTYNAVYKADGNRVTITDTGGRELCVDINEFLEPGIDLELLTTQPGPMFIQIGTQKNQEMEIRIPKITEKTLELDVLNVGTPQKAQDGVGIAAKALEIVSSVRASLGAYQNRLEFTMTNLDNAELNTAKALSKIVDADVAMEMTNYTKDNVIYQAGISVLAQANQRPQAILQILK